MLWLTLPPFVSIATVMAVRMMSGAVMHPVDIALWGLIIFLFMILSALYGLFIIHEFYVGLLPLQSVAQGILMCPLALSYGASMFQWLGVTMALCGSMVLIYTYHMTDNSSDLATKKNQAPAANLELSKEFHLPVLIAVADATGVINHVSDALLNAMGLPLDQVLGQNANDLFNGESPTIMLNNKIYEITQRNMDDGQTCFQLFLNDDIKKLSSLVANPDDHKQPDDFEVRDPVDALTDRETKLHSESYGMLRLDEELYRTHRYGHPLTTALMRIIFPSSASSKILTSEETPDMRNAFNAFCAQVRSKLRTSDIAAILSNQDILLVLPECPNTGAEAIITKMAELHKSLIVDFPIMQDVTVLHVTTSFKGTDALPDGLSLISNMKDAMARKYMLR